MNIEELRDYCLSLKGVREKMPFDEHVLVFTVKDKIFCLVNITDYNHINLKCDPEEAIKLREEYFDDVTPAFHMHKKHWNSIKTTGSITEKQMKKWIINSYHLVVAGLPKRIQKELDEE